MPYAMLLVAMRDVLRRAYDVWGAQIVWTIRIDLYCVRARGGLESP